MDQINKFRIGDKVAVIFLDEKCMNARHSSTGLQYKDLLFQTGEIMGIRNSLKSEYIIQFYKDTPGVRWYFAEKELMNLKEFKKSAKTLKVLYGRK